MPKKFAGQNSKAVAAKARKEEKASLEREKEKINIENQFWQDDDKGLAKKQLRKDEIEKKKREMQEKKKEREAQLRIEEAQNGSGGKEPQKTAKLTRATIQQNLSKNVPTKQPELSQQILHENYNKLFDHSEFVNNLEDAVSLLTFRDGAEVADRHPEKRMKAAYEAFELFRLPQLKAEQNNLRLSQLKQILRKEWMKHPSNPVNKSF